MLRMVSGHKTREANDMSLVTGTARTGEAAAVAEAPLLDGRPVILGTLAICTFYVGVRIYEQVFGWYAGARRKANSASTAARWRSNVPGFAALTARSRLFRAGKRR